MVFLWWGGRNIDTNWYNRITNRTTFVFQGRVYYICKGGKGLLAVWRWARVYVLRWVSKHEIPTTLMRMGLDDSDEHIAMGSIFLECCTCENLRDRWWKKECGVHTRNREQNKSKDEWDGSYISRQWNIPIKKEESERTISKKYTEKI